VSSNGKNAVAGSIYLIIFNKKLKLINKFIKNLIIRFLNVEFSDDAVQCCFFFLDFPHPLIRSSAPCCFLLTCFFCGIKSYCIRI
jgi:hypothetical protein